MDGYVQCCLNEKEKEREKKRKKEREIERKEREREREYYISVNIISWISCLREGVGRVKVSPCCPFLPLLSSLPIVMDGGRPTKHPPQDYTHPLKEEGHV